MIPEHGEWGMDSKFCEWKLFWSLTPVYFEGHNSTQLCIRYNVVEVVIVYLLEVIFGY
jgi:hypothetical protein